MNEKPYIKRNITGLIVLIALLAIVVVIMQRYPRIESLQSVEPMESKIIVSKDITESVRPNDNDQFWAKMYRKDPTSGKIYFVIDRYKNQVREMSEADPATFMVLHSLDGSKFSYAMDSHGIYCNDILRSDIDASTFIPPAQNHYYAMDAKYVYADCQAIAGADRATFVEVGDKYRSSNPYFYGKDKNRVYYMGVVLDKADPSTFEFISFTGYSRDAKQLYFEGKLLGTSSYKITEASMGMIKLISTPITILFEDSKTTHILDSIKVSPYMEKLLVHRNKIYFLGENGGIQFFNPETNSVETLAMPTLQLLDEENVPRINDFFIQNTDIYFLYGFNCNEYRAQCDLDLMKFDMKTYQITKIASHMKARTIVGFDEKTNALYSEYHEGDAGCNSAHGFVTEVSTGSQIKTYSFSSCSEDSDFDLKIQNLELNRASVIDDKIKSDAVFIEKGKIVMPPTSGKNWNIFYLNS